MADYSKMAQQRPIGYATLMLILATVGLHLSCSNRGTVPVGGACNADEACVTGVCIRQASPTVWAGGYCSGNCDTLTSSSSGTMCPEGDCLAMDDGRFYCVAGCANDSDCRGGYVCSAGMCLPNCNSWGCGSSHVCDTESGRCMSGPGPIPLGGACTVDGDCATQVCIREQSDSGAVAWSGGACSQKCDTTCPDGANCVQLEDGSAYCVPSCAAPGDCRSGYVCSSAVSGCLPDCRLGWSCGTNLVCDDGTGECRPPMSVPGSIPLGDACTYSIECATGICIPERRDSGTVAWSGGACSLECPLPTTCPAGATCATLEDGSAYCVPACTTQTDCRSDYVCSSAISGCLPDCRLGWSCGTSLVCDAATGECTLSNAGATPLGGACTYSPECTTGVCIPEQSDSGAWSGGACSQGCTTTPCPAESICVPFDDGSAYCARSCTASADCRTDYVCDVDLFACLPDCRRGWSCGTSLVCDTASGSCVAPSARDAGVPGDAGWHGGDDAGSSGKSDSGGFGPGNDDAGRGGPGPGGMWADQIPPSL